jgi:hypothetical protein
MALLGNDLTVRGYQLFEITKDPQRLDGQTLRHRGLGFGALKQVIANTFKLDEIVDAYRFMESNAQIGEIVVIVGPLDLLSGAGHQFDHSLLNDSAFDAVDGSSHRRPSALESVADEVTRIRRSSSCRQS